MNKESANTMLKFLEEPDGSVIGFFLTNEESNIMPTIRSRCQIIEVNFDNTLEEKYNINTEKYNNLNKITNEVLFKLEKDQENLILSNKKYFSELEKKDIKVILQMLLDIYEKNFHAKYFNCENTGDYEFLNNLSKENLKKKINVLIELLKEISYNINIDIFLDRLVIEFEAINNESL